MKHELNLVVSPTDAATEEKLKSIAASQLGISSISITFLKVLKRSIDARSRNIKINLRIEVYTGKSAPETVSYKVNYPTVSQRKPVIVIGAGPAGLFAALQLIENGFKPILLERGKDVKARRRDLAAINKECIVNPESNYCFGEGGAGTYSDGKLYTRSNKRGNIDKILKTLVYHGASEDILIDAHPHIGTNKLPQLIVNMRESIINAGGEIHFNSRVTDIIIKNNEIKGLILQNGKEFLSSAVILATGHSSRDIYEL